MTTMRDFPIFDMATETMTLRLKCWRSRISLVDETSRFFLACAYTRSFCVFTGVATVNVFSSVNQMLRTPHYIKKTVTVRFILDHPVHALAYIHRPTYLHAYINAYIYIYINTCTYINNWIL